MKYIVKNKNKEIVHTAQSTRRLPLFWLVSLVCIAIGVVTTPYLSTVALLLFGISLVLFRQEEVLAFLIGLLPFANIFKLSTSSMSLFTVCEIAAVACLLFRNRLKVSQLFVPAALAAYLFAFSFGNLNALLIIKIIAGFLLIVLAVSTFTKEWLKPSARMLSFSTIAMLLLSSNNTYFVHVQKYFLDLDYYIDPTVLMATDTLRMSGFFGDPNYCAILILLVLSLLCVLYYYKAMGAEFWLHAAFLVPLGFFTYSKSYFLCIVILAVMLIVFVLFPKHKFWAFVALVGIGVAAYLITNGKIEVINMILARFKQGDLTTGRAKLNQIYLQYIYENPKVMLFGEGISADRFLGAGNNVHCLYIELIYKLGIVGTLLYCGTLAAMLSQKRQKTERHFINYLPLTFFLVLFSFLAGLANYAFPFYIILVFLSFNYTRLDSEK